MGSPDIGGADATIRRYLATTERIITASDAAGREAARKLMKILAEADADLAARLRADARRFGPDTRFTQAQAMMYRAQVQDVLTIVKSSLLGLTTENAMRVAGASIGRTERLLNRLERQFTGIASPIRLSETAVMATEPSLLARHATSVDRYGDAMISRMEEVMARGMASGASQFDMVESLVKMGGPRGVVSLRAVEMQPGMVVRVSTKIIPEGLFVRHRSHAWRIVRTEVAEAQNAVALSGLGDAARKLPDVQKKIMAVMDERTAWDSIVVHGQVRPLNGLFKDGAGREYQRPPARPHDRETVIPWRPHWDETRTTKPMTSSQRDTMWDRNREWQAERQRRRAGIER
jgi:hypothetical protein